MKSFEYATPESLKEAASLLSEKWGETEVLAGGTDLVTCMKQLISSPRRVVSLRKIKDLRGVRASGREIQIGATTPLAEVARDKEVQKHFTAVVTVIQNIASPQILEHGTVGGDLCQRPRCWYFRNGYGLLGMSEGVSLVKEGDNRYHAIFGTDKPALFVSASSLGPVLVALGATINAEGPSGKKRQIPAAEFFRAPESDAERETSLKPNEILTSVTIPLSGLKNAAYEVRHRHGLDWPYVAAAVAFSERNGRVADARVVLGHVAATPWKASASIAALNGAELNEGTVAKVGDVAAEGAQPLSRNGYKVPMVKAAVKRALLATRA